MRSEFAANVSHELKTPLTSIKGFTDMMSSGMVKDPEDQKRFITMIGVEVDRLIELINDVLKISELESVVMPQSDDRANVLSVAEECRAALGQMAEAAKISVNLSGDNAEVAVAPGRVDVQAAQRDGKVAITVSDTGIGIPKESRERVFERFYRVDKGRARKTGGTGLGLSIVKHIVLLYGGSISLKSEPGKGTEITVLFPAVR